MKYIALSFILIIMTSCGLNVEIASLELTSTSGLADSSSPKGTVVGEVIISSLCAIKGYQILNDPDDYFSIQNNGEIILNKDNVPVGIYNLNIKASCDSQIKQVSVEVTINQFLPNIPTIPWLRHIGLTSATALGGGAASFDECYRSAVDSIGNVYCAGRTQGSLGEANGGGYDALIIKFDPNGNIIWLRQIGSASAGSLGINVSGNDRCLGVDVDNLGNVYCGGGTTGSLAEPNAGSEDTLIIKLDSNGTPLWARQVGSVTATSISGNASGTDRCFNVKVDAFNNVYCGGGTQSSLADTHAGGDDAYVVKYNSIGILQWASQYGTSVITGFGNEQCAALEVDISQNVYCTGSTQAQLGETNAGGRDAWISKMNASGAVTWIRQLGSVTSANLGVSATGNDLCWGIALDSSGNVYCAGETTSSINEPNGGGRDVFFMKLNSLGSVQWIRQMGNTSIAAFGGNASADDVCERLGVDVFDNLYCGGRTASSLGEANGGSNDVFVMKIDSSGNFDWISQLGNVSGALVGANPSGDDRCYGLSVDPLGNSYCAGRSSGNLIESNAGSSDLILIKTSPSGNFQ